MRTECFVYIAVFVHPPCLCLCALQIVRSSHRQQSVTVILIPASAWNCAVRLLECRNHALKGHFLVWPFALSSYQTLILLFCKDSTIHWSDLFWGCQVQITPGSQTTMCGTTVLTAQTTTQCLDMQMVSTVKVAFEILAPDFVSEPMLQKPDFLLAMQSQNCEHLLWEACRCLLSDCQLSSIHHFWYHLRDCCGCGACRGSTTLWN